MRACRFAIPVLASLLAGCADRISEPRSASVSVRIFSPSSISFPTTGDTVLLEVSIIDVRTGTRFPTGLGFLTRDNSVATVDARGLVRATGSGTTWVVAAADLGTPDSIAVSVTRVLDSLVVETDPHTPILSIGYDSLLPLACRVFDQAGTVIAAATTVTSATGAFEGTSCADLRGRHSGPDTLRVQAGGHQTTIPVTVAIRPALLGPPDQPLLADSIPAGCQPWAPTFRRGSTGDWELYFTGYCDASASTIPSGDLHRLRSVDGVHFSYDGVVIARDPDPRAPRGTGIENIAIVPRAEMPGWRMFFAAGGNDSYGWQIYSAVSDDERTWTAEKGVRVSNGGTFPPLRPVAPPWPVGEGIEIDRTPEGEWRMITGGYENVWPAVNTFQLVEWRSPDQIRWRYRGAVLTTHQVGPAASRSLYSPSVHQVVPGLYRMYFTGGNEHSPGGQSRIYTAVSVDRTNWQNEGIVVSQPGTDFFYSSFVDGTLVFIRQPVGIARSLGAVQVLTR
jgi:hypothetical protein